jgi:hypothetical protein
MANVVAISSLSKVALAIIVMATLATMEKKKRLRND